MVRVRGGVEEGYLGEQLALQLLQLQDVLDGVLDDGGLVHLQFIPFIPRTSMNKQSRAYVCIMHGMTQ